MNNLSRDERNRLVLDHLHKAYFICKGWKYRYPDIDISDLHSIAHEGLLMAAKWYHRNGRASYWVYAEVVISRKIKAHIRDCLKYVPISWL